MVRLYVTRGMVMRSKTYGNLKTAMSAFASKLLDRSHPDCVELYVGGELVAQSGTPWYSRGL